MATSTEKIREISDLECGKAGEYLVCADLILSGHPAIPSGQGLSYDLVTEVGNRLIKVQVKTTRGVTTIPHRNKFKTGYAFNVTRCGKGGQKSYLPGIVDLFAMVALDTREIAYLPAVDVKRCMIFRAAALEGTYYDDVRMKRDEQIREMRDVKKMKFIEIAAELGMWLAVVNRAYHRTTAYRRSKYFREFPLELALKRIS